jgi:tRNA1Val (adenine37-N6)-methyltransferase
MPRNNSFRFKQFTVRQEGAAMKVCTDACVFGAWADIEGMERILDIGTGTGLLSMMMAQRNGQAMIDAVEIEENAFGQAAENFEDGPFLERIKVFLGAVQDFYPEQKYNCIVSNPPFYQSDLRSPRVTKNLAHHAESLSFEALLKAVDRLLDATGLFHLLLPVGESILFEGMASEFALYPSKRLVLRHHSGKPPFRQLTSFSRTKPIGEPLFVEELSIYELDGKTYHAKFRELMKDFYLIF